ncbi:DUF802 domain-containing protein [Xanthomonas maliensis]|uniref:DUF802 domain-containing protein n=1 Tax=Xanthomonas maliensis TaxID=1321368 RepID=UPI0003B2E3BE|nr:DUF802 domain-containing protein [Xanthomonas maliensis]KAB7771522.1 DUF802 domain-containing protein [Xanthomonas maliensis]
MLRTIVLSLVFCLGLLAVGWVGIGYLGSHPLGAAVAAVIAACYLVGALELYRYRQATGTLETAVDALETPPATLDGWLERLHPGLRPAVRQRVRGERAALPAPVLTPYLVGLLVLLGMLGTLLGMMATLKGTGLALQSAADLQAVRGSLAAPVDGLAFAFGTSIAGVATSAMLGLLSALCRRERVQVVQRLDQRIATSLHAYSADHQRTQALQLQQQQAAALPQLVERLQALITQLDAQGAANDTRRTAEQAEFHARTEAAYTRLAESLQQSLHAGMAESAHALTAALQPVVQTTMAGIAEATTALQGRLDDAVQRQLEAISQGMQATNAAAADTAAAVREAQQRSQQALSDQLQAALAQTDQRTAALQAELQQATQQQLAMLADTAQRSADTADTHWQSALAAQERHQHASLAQWQLTLEQIAQHAGAVQARIDSAIEQQLQALDSGLQRTSGTLVDSWSSALAEQRQAAQTQHAQLQEALAQASDEGSRLRQQVEQAVQQQLEGLTTSFADSTARATASWTAAVREQQHSHQALTEGLQGTLDGFATTFDTRAAALVDAVSTRLEHASSATAEAWTQALAQQHAASAALVDQHQATLSAAGAGLDAHAATLVATLQQTHGELQAALEARDAERLTRWNAGLAALGEQLSTQWTQTGEQVLQQQQALCQSLANDAAELAAQAQAQAKATIEEVARLLQVAAEAPRAAADVVAELRQSLSDSMVRDTAMLEERTRLLATLETLLDAVNHASTEQRAAVDALVATSADLLQRVGSQLTEQIGQEAGKLGEIAAQVTGSAVEVASLGEAFGSAVELFGTATGTLNTHLQQVAGALDASLARSDDQLAYYVAQAREVVDLSMLSQKQIIEELRQLEDRRGNAAEKA